MKANGPSASIENCCSLLKNLSWEWEFACYGLSLVILQRFFRRSLQEFYSILSWCELPLCWRYQRTESVGAGMHIAFFDWRYTALEMRLGASVPGCKKYPSPPTHLSLPSPPSHSRHEALEVSVGQSSSVGSGPSLSDKPYLAMVVAIPPPLNK